MLFLVLRYTFLCWTMCLLVISRVWLSIFFFAFETVAWKLFPSLRSLILKTVILRILVPFQSQLLKIVIAYEGFSYLLTYRYRNHVNSFNQAGKKRLFFLTGSLGCDSESAMFFQLTFCSIMPHNKTLVLKHRQGESMWFPDRNIKKSKLENHAKWVWFFLSRLLEQSETLKMQSFFFRRWDIVCRPRVLS